MAVRTLVDASAGADRRLVGPCLMLSFSLLLAGLVVPSMSIERLPFLADHVSILGGLAVLWRDDQLMLFLLLLVFSVLFPVAKLVTALWVWYLADLARHRPRDLVRRLEALAKWSMLDVMVVALVVVAINVTIISDVFLHPGVYLFSGSIILSMIGLRRIGRWAEAACGDG